jgi:hypothetical protein
MLLDFSQNRSPMLANSSNHDIPEIETHEVCPGGRPRRAFILYTSWRDQDLLSGKGVLAHDLGACSPLDIRCYFRRVAAEVLVLACEMTPACIFRCCLQDPL